MNPGAAKIRWMEVRQRTSRRGRRRFGRFVVAAAGCGKRAMTWPYNIPALVAMGGLATAGSGAVRAMWRPAIDSQVEIEEFCRLYYGPAAADVLRHIDSVHEDYVQKDRPDGVDPTYMSRADQERYIATSGAILSAAEAKVNSPELKLRVAGIRESRIKKPDITLLARNEPPGWKCAKCGKPATQIQAMGWGLDSDALLCDDCVGDDEDEGFLPVVNSPRTGVCGYCG